MTVIIPHHKTKQEVVDIIDKAATEVLTNGVGHGVKIVDARKAWADSTMDFSLKGKMGFLSAPLAGQIVVDDQNVTVNCELPGMIRNMVGEAKVRAGVAAKMKEIVAG